MSLFAIGDLHFGFGLNKPMDIFGERWKNHEERIKRKLAGGSGAGGYGHTSRGLSWGMRIGEAAPHLDLISSLPGRKVLVCGNHDYWWGSTSKLRCLYPGLIFIKNDSSFYRDYAICGTRGWVCPKEHPSFPRRIIRYITGSRSGSGFPDDAVRKGYKKIILALHYPPTNDKKEPSGFTDIIGRYPQIEKVVYGHLHGEVSFGAGIKGVFGGTEYELVSADYIGFRLKRILP